MKIMNERGYGTLTTVIIFGIISVSIAVSILALGLRSNKTSTAKEKYHTSRAIAVACAEHALFALRIDFDNPLGTSPLPLASFAPNSCTVNISGTGNTNRTVDVEATTDQSTFRIEVVINQVLPVTELGSWEEVESF